jgi:glycosyltransferase involved in cell wall biosynthesis
MLDETVSGRVSVIVPTRNAARTIGACLSSLRRQTHPDLEVVVVDNASSDGSPDMARSLADQVVVTGPERSAQRNAGAAVSTGEFLVFLDSDMVAAPLLTSEVVRVFRRNPCVHALVLPERSIGVGFWAQCKALERHLYVGDRHVEAARAFRRSAFVEAGGYDERIHGGGEDWDLPERLERLGGTVGRTATGVIHDEGRISLTDDLARKFYYGRTFGRYVRKRPGAAARKVFRGALLRKAPTLARHPKHGAGVLAMKTLELAAVMAGMAVSVFRPHPAETQGRQ